MGLRASICQWSSATGQQRELANQFRMKFHRSDMHYVENSKGDYGTCNLGFLTPHSNVLVWSSVGAWVEPSQLMKVGSSLSLNGFFPVGWAPSPCKCLHDVLTSCSGYLDCTIMSDMQHKMVGDENDKKTNSRHIEAYDSKWAKYFFKPTVQYIDYLTAGPVLLPHKFN